MLRRADSGVFRDLTGWTFAFAILVLWVAGALADSVTLRVVAASPGYTPEGRPSIAVKVDDEGRSTPAQFTNEHVGEDIEFLSEGSVLLKARLRTIISNGLIIIAGDFSSNEAVRLLFCLLSNAALATAEELRTMTHSGIPLDERILVRVRGVLLGIPAGYLWPWPGQDLRNRVNEWRGVDFDFWMPDRRYPEIDPISYAGFRPKERGRGEPARDAYIVQVRELQPIKLGEPGYISPEQGFRNSTSIAGIASYSFENEEFGLVRFWNHNWPYPQPEPFTFYRHVEGSDPQVHLRCTPPHEKRLPFPGCAGEIHFAADDLGFFIHFPRDELPNWRQMVLAVRDLFNAWRTAG